MPALRVQIPQVSKRLGHENGDVRISAVRALAQIANKGNPAAIDAVVNQMEDADEDVRHEAISSLALIAERGDTGAIRAVCRRLEDEDDDMKFAERNL